MKEACGVVGIIAPGRNVAHLCFDALYALQHRGQESAGMATFDNKQITVVKDNGLVSHVFSDTTLRALSGSHVIGHTRYSTSGSANWTAAQPVYRSAGTSGFALGHNGNLTNTAELADVAGIQVTTMLSDSDLVAELLAREIESGAAMPHALRSVLSKAEGAFSMVILESDTVYAVRDPYGFRPLCIGRLGTEDAPEGWIVASESPALDVIGAAFVREIKPGEMVTITEQGVSFVQLLEPAGEKKCSVFLNSFTLLVPTRTSWVTKCTRHVVAWVSFWLSSHTLMQTLLWECPTLESLQQKALQRHREFHSATDL